MADTASRMTVRLVGGRTALMEIGALRLLTDPVLDDSESPDTIGPIDVVLLSRDRSGDDLGSRGRALLERAPLVLTTPGGAARLGRCARALLPWYHLSLACSDETMLRITGVPAQRESGSAIQLTGFVLSGVGLPTSYVSTADTSLDVAREVARRCAPIDVAVLLAGAADTSRANGNSEQVARATAILGAPVVIPAHVNGRDSVEDIRAALCRRGLGDRLCVLAAGETRTF